MNTFKLMLTEEQWAEVLQNPDVLTAHLKSQQPDLLARLCPQDKPRSENSPVGNMNAEDAIASIGHMRSKEKIQHILDTDDRVTVQEAATKRLAELNA